MSDGFWVEKGLLVIEVGQIAGVHGIRGAIKLSAGSGPEEIFAPGETIFLGGGQECGAPFVIESALRHKKALLLYLRGVTTRNGAENLVGRSVRVQRDRLPRLEQGEYYWFEIIGLEVFTTGNKRLGVVTEIIETGSNDVYVVSDEHSGSQTLVPALEWVIAAIALDEKKMVVDLPQGL